MAKSEEITSPDDFYNLLVTSISKIKEFHGKKDQESQEKTSSHRVAEEKPRIFEKKKKPKILEEFANGKVVHSEGATSNESLATSEKKVRKKRTKKRKRKKGIRVVIFQLHNKNLAGLVIFIRCNPNRIFTFLYFTLVKTKVLTVSGTKNALPEDVKVAKWNSLIQTISLMSFSTKERLHQLLKTNVWVKRLQ